MLTAFHEALYYPRILIWQMIARGAGDGGNMDWKTFFSTLLVGISWPAALVVIALMFREQLATLFERIREFSGPAGTGAKFAEKLEEARAIAASVPPPADAPNGLAEETVALPPANADQERALEFAKKFSVAAILSSYQRVERMINEVGRSLGVAVTGVGGYAPSTIGAVAAIAPEAIDLIKQVREIRNAAVHSAKEVTFGEALEYDALCDQVIDLLKAALNRRKLQE